MIDNSTFPLLVAVQCQYYLTEKMAQLSREPVPDFKYLIKIMFKYCLSIEVRGEGGGAGKEKYWYYFVNTHFAG